MKKHKRAKLRKKPHAHKIVALFVLGILALSCVILYKQHSESVLGLTVGSTENGTQQGTGSQITPTKTQVSQPTVVVTSAPLPTNIPTVVPTTVVIPTQSTVQNPTITPTPTLITPQDPIYVPVVDATKQDQSTIDIVNDTTTVVIESTPTGLSTTAEVLTPKTEPVSDSQTIITSQTGSNTQVPVSSEPSVIDKFIALLSGQTAQTAPVQQVTTANISTEQSKSESQPILYQKVYVADTSTPTFETDPTETLAALDKWLGLNDMTLSSTSVNEFSISQGGIEAIVNPTDGKVAVNMSRMVALINTPTGFKELSYNVKNATDYSIDLNIISKVKGTVVVRDTPTELVYDYTGVSNQYLLAFIPVGIEKNVCVSAKTKNICGVKQTLLSRVLDLFSI